jgi:hypothetical protein
MVSKPSSPEAIEPLQKDQKPRKLISISHPRPKGLGFQVVKSKYYTKEVYERLGELLKMDPDQYTWDHVFELERIAELIMKEAMKSNRRDLAAYVGRLRAFIVLTQARLIKKGILPV